MKYIFYKDVPKKLIDLLKRIKFTAISEAEGRAALAELERYIAGVSVIKRRTNMATAPTIEVMLPDSVPLEAIDAINRYDYQKIASWQISMAMPIVEKQLKARGLL